jgi:diadenosine tetraphosphate (Ap4A) HIT family hydrolase
MVIEASACLASKLIAGEAPLPGGRIFSASCWVVEHCVGPMNVGTLVVKPLHHCTHVWDLSDAEAREVGPLLRAVAEIVRSLCEPEQVYVSLWSHARWVHQQLHFLVQPITSHLRAHHGRPGPYLQAEMFAAGVLPPAEEVEQFAARAENLLPRVYGR